MRKSVPLVVGVALIIAVTLAGLVLPGVTAAQSEPELAPELYVYNWSDYIDPSLLDEYEEMYGVRIVYDNFATNEELFARMQAGAQYDLVFPTDYMIARMIELGLITPLDKANIPNLKNIDPFNLDNWFDPGGDYCVPYNWGTTGIAYRLDLDLDEPPSSWGALFDPEQAAMYAAMGGINLLDDPRELIAAGLAYLGYPINDTDPEHLAEVRDTIIDVLPNVKYINSSDYQDTLLIPGEVAISHSWDGSTIKAALATVSDEYPEGLWRHVIPEEGAPRWQDGMCIPTSSPRKATAEHFINFLLEPEHAARSANLTGYMTANLAAHDLLLPEIHNMMPDEEQLQRLEWLRPLDEDGMMLWDQIYTEIRASQ